MAPFLSIGVRCGYVMWNKNAKDSYSGLNQNTETINFITTNNNFDYSKNYHLMNSNLDNNASANYGSGRIYFDLLSYTTQSSYDFSNAKSFQINVYSGNRSLYYIFYDENSNQVVNANSNSVFDLVINIKSNIDYETGFDYILANSNSLYWIDYFNAQQLDNAFSYSVSQISNDPVFNWTRNTGIYQPINAMVQGLEIENDTLQILLAYWSLMTAVYIVFDIIIFCFTKLTHFINE